MIKGLIIAVLFTFSTLVHANYVLELTPSKDKLILSMDGNPIAYAPYKGTPEQQKKLLMQALHSMQFCGGKGNWANTVAQDAKADPDGKQFHLNYIKSSTKGKDIPQRLIDGSNDIIHAAYRFGYKDPLTFGQAVIVKCLVEVGKPK